MLSNPDPILVLPCHCVAQLSRTQPQPSVGSLIELKPKTKLQYSLSCFFFAVGNVFQYFHFILLLMPKRLVGRQQDWQSRQLGSFPPFHCFQHFQGQEVPSGEYAISSDRILLFPKLSHSLYFLLNKLERQDQEVHISIFFMPSSTLTQQFLSQWRE